MRPTSRRRYAGVVVEASPNQEAATAFLDWLTGPDGQASCPRSGSCRRHDIGADSGASTAGRPPGGGRATWRRAGRVRAWGVDRPARRRPHLAVPRSAGRRPGRCAPSWTARSPTPSRHRSCSTRSSSASSRRRSASCSRSRSGCRSPGCWHGARSADRGSSRRSSTCRSSCRRRSPAWPCCWCSAAAGLLGDAARPQHPVHDLRRDPRPDVRLGTVLRPLGADRHRRTSIATSRTPRASTAPRSSSCSGGSRRRSRRPPSRPASSWRGRARSASSARRSCSPATSRAGRRPCRSSSTASSRAAISTRRSRPRPSSCWPRSASSSPSASSTGGASSTRASTRLMTRHKGGTT